jgi:AAA domain
MKNSFADFDEPVMDDPGFYSQRKPNALPLTFFDDLSEKPPPKPWLIKNVIARGETSSWIAPPGKGKSALLTDIGVHVAAGRDWRNYRSKGRAGVIYFALERADLVRRRLIAHKRRDNLVSLPVAVVSQVIDLMHRSCVETIRATVVEAEQRFGCGAGLVIFDTYSKGIAAGGGDEDKARDQNIVQANLRRLFDRGCNVHIAGVGHTGKDESRGERGSNARVADIDLQSQITGDEIKIATTIKANDQPEQVLTSFKLEPFDFEPDEDGEPFRTYILAPELFADRAASPIDNPRLSKNQRTLFDLLYSAGANGLPLASWNDKARDVGIGVTRKADLYDIRSALLSKRLVREYADRWYVNHSS